MGFFANQLDSVVEWNEAEHGGLMWKWEGQEIKKGSVLILRPAQEAIFMYNGVVEGVFTEPGRYDIESQILPFLTTLFSFKFGFKTPLRAEVLFINTREQLVKWGTKNPINLQTPELPGGMPIRAFGSFACKIADRDTIIAKIAGIQNSFGVEDVKERVIANLDQLLMSWIGKAGKNMFNLQADAKEIAAGICSDLNEDTSKIGIATTDFMIESFSYPEEVRKMQEKAAGQAMVGDVNKYMQMAAADAMGAPGQGGTGSHMASDMVQLQMGMMMGQQMMQGMQQAQQSMQQPMQGQMQQAAPVVTPGAAGGVAPKFCPECGTPTNGAKFCPNCGTKLV